MRFAHSSGTNSRSSCEPVSGTRSALTGVDGDLHGRVVQGWVKFNMVYY